MLHFVEHFNYYCYYSKDPHENRPVIHHPVALRHPISHHIQQNPISVLNANGFTGDSKVGQECVHPQQMLRKTVLVSTRSVIASATAALADNASNREENTEQASCLSPIDLTIKKNFIFKYFYN